MPSGEVKVAITKGNRGRFHIYGVVVNGVVIHEVADPCGSRASLREINAMAAKIGQALTAAGLKVEVESI